MEGTRWEISHRVFDVDYMSAEVRKNPAACGGGDRLGQVQNGVIRERKSEPNFMGAKPTRRGPLYKVNFPESNGLISRFPCPDGEHERDFWAVRGEVPAVLVVNDHAFVGAVGAPVTFFE